MESRLDQPVRILAVSPPLVQQEPDIIALTFTNICNRIMETKLQPRHDREKRKRKVNGAEVGGIYQ